MKTLTLLSLFCIILFCSGKQIDQTIQCVKSYSESLKSRMRSSLFNIFYKSFPNTLQTTVSHYDLTPGKQQTYIITGDITAMWLRDSTNQFLPYIRMEKDCPHIQSLAKGLINTQAQFIMIDAYTNAYKRFQGAQQRPFYLNDKTQTLVFGIPVDVCGGRNFNTKSIWQRKFQIDSLASFLRLIYQYENKFKTIDFLNIKVLKAIKRVLSVLDQQVKDEAYQKLNGNYYYTFARSGNPRQLDQGKIKPSNRTGMIKTGFRPSDDPNQLAYNVPGNAMLCTYLKLVALKVLPQVKSDSIFKNLVNVLTNKMLYFAEQVRNAIYDHGIVIKDGKRIFAYEVSGFGDSKTYDDANLPSLLSLPYMGFISDLDDQIYRNTRQYILSSNNIYFYKNGTISGVGSSHTPVRNIWPLALMTQILTSSNSNQIMNCLDSLQKSSPDDLMHESFNVDRPKSYTRSWFAWANSFFGQTIIHLALTNPQVLK